ncbi:MAG: OB-fold nucleic acid binding domain-containing protein [Candidatus Limnocylindria bacterium]
MQPTASPTPGAEVVPIATARALPDGTEVTVEGVALTRSDFADGGGYLADASGGLAVLLTDGSFARGDRLLISGAIDDRYAQRTLRADGADVVVLGAAVAPAPIEITTGAVGEDVEGRLVRITGAVLAGPTALSTGIAFDVNDGSGPVRLLVESATGIDVSAWEAGYAVDAIGVVGQRDSSGTGASGYRVQPRDAADIQAAGPPPSPPASPGASSTPEATPEPSEAADVISVAAARRLSKGASAVVRGVVTLSPGLVDPATAVLQDASGAIVLRVGDEVGPVVRGTMVEVRGVRSTLSGMETLRVSTPPTSMGTAAEPVAGVIRTGEAGEVQEATLVVVRGGLVAAPRRSSAGTLSLEIDDGSGPLRVSIASATRIEAAQIERGTWIEVRGVLGQETTGSLPLAGYRIWPRDASDLRVIAPATAGTTSGGGSTGGGGSGEPTGATLGSLDTVGGAAVAGRPIGATLVVGPWEELGVGGLLWDGVRLVAIHVDAGALVAGVLGNARPPVALQATGLRAVGVQPSTGIPVAGLPDEPGALVPSGLPPAPPLTALGTEGGDARWVAVIGRLDPRADAPALLVDGGSLSIDRRCQLEPVPEPGTVSVTGVLVGEPPRLVVPCGGIVPAPLLARATRLREANEPAAPTGAVTASGTESPSGTLPAVLLLLAAATLTGGAGAARWAPRLGAPAPDSEAVASGEAEEAMSPPALTLVPLPHERAP